MHELHTLPEKWHTMTYADFPDVRCKRMAAIIRRGFDSLTPAAPRLASGGNT